MPKKARADKKVKVLMSLPDSVAKILRHASVNENRDMCDIVAELIRSRYPVRVSFRNARSEAEV